MNYKQYLKTSEWKKLRQQVLDRDKCCQTCVLIQNLEVHHKHYKTLGNEKLDDLITLCKECHEVITNRFRKDKYLKKELKLIEIKKENIIRGGQKNDIRKIELQNYRNITPIDAQRCIGRPIK